MVFHCATNGRFALPRAANTLVIAVWLLLSSSAAAQSLDVTFRYVPQPGDNFIRAFLPGEFNNWGAQQQRHHSGRGALCDDVRRFNR